MKRRDLIAHLQGQGCALVREGRNIHGGETRPTFGEPQSLVIARSAITWREKYVETWESRIRERRISK